MKTLKIENEIKKNVIEVETWTNLEKQVGVEIETGWRFATYTINVDDEEVSEIDPENNVGFIVSDYEIEEMECSESFSFSFNEVFNLNGQEPLTEEEQDAIISELESLYEEDGFGSLETAGWGHHDTETFIYGPLVIEEVK